MAMGVACESARGVCCSASSSSRRLRGRRYDVAINLISVDSTTPALVTALSGAALKIGFENLGAPV